MKGEIMKTDGKDPIDVGECDGKGLIELSVSKAKRWKACQQSYEYRYVNKLTPKTKSRPLTVGTLVHKCLEARALGQAWVDVIKTFKEEEWSKLFDEEKVELGDIPTDTYLIMRGYHYYYKEDFNRYKTIGAEIPFRVRINNTPIVLTGVIDLIVLDKVDNSIWCFEHKTVKRDIPSEDFRMTDIQTTIYLYGMKALAPKLGYQENQVKGIVLDYLKTKTPTIPEVLKNGTLSKRKISCDYYTYLQCIKSINGNPEDYQDILEYMKTNIFYTRIPITRSDSLTKAVLEDIINVGKQILAISGKCPTRNLAWTCDRPKCEYRDLCIAEIQGFDTNTLIKLNYDVKEDDKEDDEEAGDKSE